LVGACQSKPKKNKVACVGDSITEGYGIHPESTSSYPVVLDSLLGNNYSVLNAGRSSATLQKEGNLPYWNVNEFSNVFAFEPDIIVIKLGTNDTKPVNWNSKRFKKDYQALVDTFRTIPTHPMIFLCKPVPVFHTNWGINDSTLTNGVIPIVSELANDNNLTLIDLYEGLEDDGVNFPDGIHPNKEGAKVLAEIVAEEIQSEE